MRAFAHWHGNTQLTLAAIIIRAIEQSMQAHGGEQGP